jgi:hypothetical protein
MGVFAPELAPAAPLPTQSQGKGGSRAGKKPCPFWIHATAKRQLDRMVFEMETTAQALITEAINDLFKKHNLPPIA